MISLYSPRGIYEHAIVVVSYILCHEELNISGIQLCVLRLLIRWMVDWKKLQNYYELQCDKFIASYSWQANSPPLLVNCEADTELERDFQLCQDGGVYELWNEGG